MNSRSQFGRAAIEPRRGRVIYVCQSAVGGCSPLSRSNAYWVAVVPRPDGGVEVVNADGGPVLPDGGRYFLPVAQASRCRGDSSRLASLIRQGVRCEADSDCVVKKNEVTGAAIACEFAVNRKQVPLIDRETLRLGRVCGLETVECLPACAARCRQMHCSLTGWDGGACAPPAPVSY